MGNLDIQLIAPILERHQVVLAYLFGSVARGEHGPHSDVDVAVVFSDDKLGKEDFKRRMALASEISQTLGVVDTDVINLKTAKEPLIKHNAVFTGRPILVKDNNLRFAVERAIVREYEKTKPLRRIASLVLRQHLQADTFGRPLVIA